MEYIVTARICKHKRTIDPTGKFPDYCLSCLKKNSEHNNTDRFLQHKFGITLEQKRQMWRDQDGRCFLCGKPLVKSIDCQTDHDHDTHIVRRILCRNCNYRMAAIDDVCWREKAIAYCNSFLPKKSKK
jgi:Recombination endonuclease VII